MILAAIAALSSVCPVEAVLPEGSPITLVTVATLTSKSSAKGDMVALRTAEDVSVNGAVVIPKGTEATGQVFDARAAGGLGVSGRLTLAPLYLRVGDTVVRLVGRAAAKGSVPAGTVVGMTLLTPVFSGSSATIPAGTAVPASVYHAVTLCAPSPATSP
jgi:hypothetical protein